MNDSEVTSGRLSRAEVLLNQMPHICATCFNYTILHSALLNTLKQFPYSVQCMGIECNGLVIDRMDPQYNYHIAGMGNEQSANLQDTLQRRNRYRTVEHGNGSIYKSKVVSSRKNDDSFNNNNESSFIPPLNPNRSVLERDPAELQQDDQYNHGGYHSIDVNDRQRARGNSQRKVARNENDRILQMLSRKNQELRKQLKEISDNLTERLKRKKLVPKKKSAKEEDEESTVKQEDKEQIGLKRELQNAYKQIQMYKKLLADLKGKQEGVTADHRVNVLENQILIKDEEIEKYQKKKEALQKIRNKQNDHIKNQMNDELKSGVDTYKKQVEQLRLRLAKLAKDDRARQESYKKQQAYLCDLERKWRQLDDSYFPDLNNKIKKDQPKTATSDSQVNQREYINLAEEARLLRLKHDEYNRKIQAMLLFKNKRIEEQNDLKDQVVYKERIIEALKIKIQTIQRLLKPRKLSLFGYDSQAGSQNQSQYNDNQSEIERQLQQELNQDQFDIKHLIANIPKPVRKKPQEISNGYSSNGSSGGQNRPKGVGMVITSEKAAPKKWGAITTRSQERGKHFKGELAFEDRGQFDGEVQPIIVGVNVWVNKNNAILGIQAIYLNNNELRYGVKSSDSADGIIRRFDLQTPDYLKNLTLSMSKQGFVESITLNSKQGKIGKFGNKRAEDETINYGIASNERPFMFYGASSLYEAEPRLNCFGLQICNE